MIEFNDNTLIETKGNYKTTFDLMKKEGAPRPWMLSSKVYVHTDVLTGVYNCHFWDNGKIIIDEIYRPVSLAVPNDDIAELAKWSTDNGWTLPEPAAKLLETPRYMEFWERQFMSGFIKCSIIENKESDLLDRLAKSEDVIKREEST